METPVLPVHLLNAEPGARVETVLRGLVGIYQVVFPSRLRAVYLLGSRSDDTAATVSDIDGVIVFAETFRDEAERTLAQAILGHCQRMSPYRLDFSVLSESELYSPEHASDVRFKLGGQLFWGEDIREKIPLPSLAEYRRQSRRWPAEFIPLLHDCERMEAPLAYPDPEDEFFGYTRKRAPRWYPPDVEQGTKELVATLCWTATAWLALADGLFVGTRAECVPLAKERLAADHGDLIERAYQRCKRDWDYLVPTAADDREELRRICAATLEFCNAYVQRFEGADRNGTGVGSVDPRCGDVSL